MAYVGVSSDGPSKSGKSFQCWASTVLCVSNESLRVSGCSVKAWSLFCVAVRTTWSSSWSMSPSSSNTASRVWVWNRMSEHYFYTLETLHIRGRQTFTFRSDLLSFVDGEEREGNLSLDSGFIPNSSLILLQLQVWCYFGTVETIILFVRGRFAYLVRTLFLPCYSCLGRFLPLLLRVHS